MNGQKAAQDCGILQISQSDNKDLGDPITIETYYRPSKHPASERIRYSLRPMILFSAAGILEALTAVSLLDVPWHGCFCASQKHSPSPTLFWSTTQMFIISVAAYPIANRILPSGNFQSVADLFIQGLRKHGMMGISFLFSVISL